MRNIFLIFIFILLSSFLYSTIINVPANQPTIQAGIDVATNGDTVLVQPGTYVENINYNGKLITVGSLFLTTLDPAYISSTIIDGNSSGSVVSFESGEDATAVLCGFTIANGYASYVGGGINCESSSPSLKNLTITGNSTVYVGGGIYCWESSPYIKNVTISGNSAGENGGGICCVGSSPSLQDVTISGNSAGVDGGGIYFHSSNPSLENLTIIGNSAVHYGGGIRCSNSNIIIINSILWNNSQEISYTSSSVTVTYSDIQGGWAGTGNIYSDPLFIDPGNGDYHLQSTSPCIDAGDPASQLDPDGTIADMGAYFFNQYFGPVWHISTTGSDISGIGSEEAPFATIQHGINTAFLTDTVLVHPGTYYENVNFAGRLITVASLFLTTQDTTYISSTVIDGNQSGSVVIFENGEDSTAVLCGLTITNGLGGGTYPDFYGGGIHCYHSDPNLKNLIITNNSVLNFGGGIYCGYSSPNVKNVVIVNNHADIVGGGIFCYDNSNPSLKNLTITDNSANDEGSGIYCEDSRPTLLNSILWNNSPQEIYIASGSITATYSNIEGGWAGTGNIEEDPLFVDQANGDYHLTEYSHCIDTGDPHSPLDPDGTVADMGAYYYHQIIAPENLTINILETDVNLSWDVVPDANSYIVYSSDNPYADFAIDSLGSFTGESWSTSIGNLKKFYYIIASTEISKSEHPIFIKRELDAFIEEKRKR